MCMLDYQCDRNCNPTEKRCEGVKVGGLKGDVGLKEGLAAATAPVMCQCPTV